MEYRSLHNLIHNILWLPLPLPVLYTFQYCDLNKDGCTFSASTSTNIVNISSVQRSFKSKIGPEFVAQ